jgi:hypothetical protein
MGRTARGKRCFTANDRGTGPATSVSPASLADEDQKAFEYQPFACAKCHAPAVELIHGVASFAESEPVDEAGSPEGEIQAIFRCWIAGLRRLPKRERSQALRAALEWLWFAEAALREKRLAERNARYRLRQQVRPPAPS